MNFTTTIKKHEHLINLAKEYMGKSVDNEHTIDHVYDVIYYIEELVKKLELDIDYEVCIISAFWHDVGRIQSAEGHEKLSAEMLKKEMLELNYDEKMINECYQAIENHKWNMTPSTTCGRILRDADKLAWIGEKRWIACLDKNQNLDAIIDLLPKLKSEILYFEESKVIFDREIVNLVNILYKKIYKEV